MANFLLSLASLAAKILPDPVKRGIYRVKPLAGRLRNTPLLQPCS